MGVALGFSVFHLHYPKNSWRSLSNWMQSPLSQEALVTGVFFASLTVPVALEYIKPSLLQTVTIYIEWIQFVSASGLVISMARLYMLRTAGAWNRFSTPLAFFATSLLTGTAVVALSVKTEALPIWILAGAGIVMKAASGFLILKKPVFVGAMQESRHELPVWCRKGGQVYGNLASLFVFFFINQIAGIVLLIISELFSRIEFYVLHGHDRRVFHPVKPAVSSWRDTLE